MLLGAATLYVAWANAAGLLPPFALCGYVGDQAVHLGDNFALAYSGGCGPYDGAYVAFALLTTAGLGLVGGGRSLERRRR